MASEVRGANPLLTLTARDHVLSADCMQTLARAQGLNQKREPVRRGCNPSNLRNRRNSTLTCGVFALLVYTYYRRSL